MRQIKSKVYLLMVTYVGLLRPTSILRLPLLINICQLIQYELMKKQLAVDALQIMESRKVYNCLVVDNEDILKGVITIGDVVRAGIQ